MAAADLKEVVDWQAVECLNQKPTHTVQNALKQVSYSMCNLVLPDLESIVGRACRHARAELLLAPPPAHLPPLPPATLQAPFPPASVTICRSRTAAHVVCLNVGIVAIFSNQPAAALQSRSVPTSQCTTLLRSALRRPTFPCHPTSSSHSCLAL